MINITKTELKNIFDGDQTWEEIAKEFATKAELPFETESDQKKMVKLVQEMFKANGYNLRSRKRKTGASWYTIIDDTNTVSEPETTEEFA